MMNIFRSNNVTGFKHHSGIGGYSKMLIPLILTSVNYTVVLDTDIVVTRDPADFWNHLHKEKEDILVQAKRLSAKNCFGHNYRLNSGVVGMNVRAMRDSNWFRILWNDINSLPMDPKCGHMVRNGTLMAGDQEFTSRVCEITKKCAYYSERKFHQDRCSGFGSKKTALFIHNNCGYKSKGSTENERDKPLPLNASTQ